MRRTISLIIDLRSYSGAVDSTVFSSSLEEFGLASDEEKEGESEDGGKGETLVNTVKVNSRL